MRTQTICIDAWNQTGIREVSLTCRSAATGHERNDADIKMAIIRTSGFKAGQSKDGGLGYESEVSPTVNAHMSALEPTMVKIRTVSAGFKGNNSAKARGIGYGKEVSQTIGEQMPGLEPTMVSISFDSKGHLNSPSREVSPTVRAGSFSKSHMNGGVPPGVLNKRENKKGNTEMTAEVRRLTTGECGKLQGFPEGYLSSNGQGDSAQYSEAGNSWAVPNARIVIKGIHRVDEKLCGRKRGFKYGTISSGVEAHTMASVGLGDKAVFYSEISPAPCSVLKHHYPDVPNLGDMTLVDYDAEKKCIHNRPYDGYQPPSKDDLGFEPYKTPEPVEIPAEFGEVDLVSGGTPCQDLSVAGKRAGAVEGSNTRSSLAFQLPRIGAAVGAKWIVWENVYGAFSSNGGRDFAWLVHRMSEYGYKLAWRTFDAQFVRSDMHPRGVPQRRRRVWIVGYRGDDWRVPCEALFEPIKVLGDEPPVRTVGVGFTEKAAETASVQQQDFDELLEFNDFMTATKENIIKLLVKKGICISPEDRRKELEAAKNALACGQDDLFGGDLFGPTEKKHQGRGLKAKDLDLKMPDEPSLAKVGLANLYEWAKTVCKEVTYCGKLFKRHDGEPCVEDLEEQMLSNIGNAGFLSDGIICTMKMPEWNAGVTEEELATMPKELAELYDGDVCGLSDILDPYPDKKYNLSWRACYGILKRAVNRMKMLPIELAYALVERIIDEAPIVKWYALNGKDVAKEGQLSERAIAKIAYDDYIEVEAHWVDVEAVEPKKGEETEDEVEDEGEDEGEGEEE